MAKFVPKIAEPILNYNSSPFVDELVSYGSKLLRAKILYNREFSGMKKADVKGPRDAYDHEWTQREEPGQKNHRFDINPNYGSGRGTALVTDGYLSETAGLRESRAGKIQKEFISIVDLDYRPDEHDATRFYKELRLPFVPGELTYQPESNFVGIASFGRNNPFYQFTGSEDTLTFEIDWLSNQNDRKDVLFNCRWLEALTKGDAYEDVPHRVKLVWGNDNTMFEDSVWLLVSAPYRLTNFVRGYNDNNGTFISTSMLPSQAFQTVTFKRLTKNNRATRDIIGNLQ